MQRSILAASIAGVAFIYLKEDSKVGKDPYKPYPWTIHVVPHSHDDVGWIKTADQYFDGSRKDLQWTNVKVELTTVIQALQRDPSRRFSEVEMAFFKKWYEMQNDEVKEQTKALIKSGQLELINAGWSMHDEAAPIYDDMINNMMYGQKWILEEFGVKPRIGWQIDPFGHSNTNAKLFYEMGFEAMFFGRHEVKEDFARLPHQKEEWIQFPSVGNLGTEQKILFHKLKNNYIPPYGFDFDIMANDPIWENNKSMNSFNAEQEAANLIGFIEDYSTCYLTDNLFLLFGLDFDYMDAFQNFQEMDNMMAYMKEHYGDKYIFKYSTPSEYVDSINAQNQTWPTKSDDLFPYADGVDSWWTGYFSSRPNAKAFVRQGSHIFHASSQLASQAMLNPKISEEKIQNYLKASDEMLNQMGVYQHHDAVSGTAKQLVANDYAKRLSKAITLNNDLLYSDLMNQQVSDLTGGFATTTPWQQCIKTNSTYLDCPIANFTGPEYHVSVHNPSSLTLKTAQFSVPNGKFEVYEFNGTSGEYVPVLADVLCNRDTDEKGKEIKECKMYIQTQIKPRDINLYKLVKNDSVDLESPQESLKSGDYIQGKKMILKFKKGEESRLSFDFSTPVYEGSFDFMMRYWPSYQSISDWSNGHQSNPYLFRPIDYIFESLQYSDLVEAKISKGKFISKMVFYFQKYDKKAKEMGQNAIVHVTIDPDLEDVFQFDVDLDSLPTPYVNGYEFMATFEAAQFDNNGTFYTDSNGLDMQKRILNHRSFYNFTKEWSDEKYPEHTQNISSNFYPVGSAISMRDVSGEFQFTVSNDRAQGGSSLKNGRIELMQNRRLALNYFGPVDPEPLNETDKYGNGQRVPATYYVQIHPLKYVDSLQRMVQMKTDDPAQYFFTEQKFEKVSNQTFQSQKIYSDFMIQAGVKDTVKIVTVPMEQKKVMIRVQNIADKYDSFATSKDVNITMVIEGMWKSAHSLDSELGSYTLTETSVTGNMPIQEMQSRRLKWKTEDEPKESTTLSYTIDDGMIVLEPTRIRVFILEFNQI